MNEFWREDDKNSFLCGSKRTVCNESSALFYRHTGRHIFKRTDGIRDIVFDGDRLAYEYDSLIQETRKKSTRSMGRILSSILENTDMLLSYGSGLRKKYTINDGLVSGMILYKKESCINRKANLQGFLKKEEINAILSDLLEKDGTLRGSRKKLYLNDIPGEYTYPAYKHNTALILETLSINDGLPPLVIKINDCSPEYCLDGWRKPAIEEFLDFLNNKNSQSF